MSQSDTANRLLAEINQLESRLDGLRHQLGVLEPSFSSSGASVVAYEQGMQSGSTDLSRTLEYLMAITAAESGEQLYLSMARHLAEAVKVDGVHISELIHRNPDRVRKLAVWQNGQFIDCPEEDLAGTPCEMTHWHGEYICEEGVQARFPKDLQLAEQQVISYCGVRFSGRNGESLGHICLIDTKPLRNAPHLWTILRLCASRVGMELEHKRADQALQESESRLRLALSGAHGGAWEWDIVNGTVWWSPEMFNLWGKQPDHSMTFDKFLSGVFEADRERVQRAFNESLSQRTDYYCEFRGQHPKRGLRWFASRARFVCDSQGQPQRLVGISQDITEQKQAEQLLRDSEERLQAVIQNTKSVAIQWYDAQGRVVLWNAASEKMYGYSAEEAMGRTLDQLMLTQEEAATFHKALARVERTEETLYPQEYPFRRRSGETGACLSSLSRIPGRDGGHWFVCMDVDITSQRQAEERVRARDAELTHALRLATMGEMVAQVSHEVNQPLYAIGNYAQASLNELSKPDGGDRKEVQEWLQRIHRASSRSSEVLRQIAGFVRPDDRKRNPTSVNQMIEGALELLSWKTGRQKIDIQFDPLEPDVALRIDAIQFEQVLLNLLSNACEAVVGGGTPAGRVSIAAVQRAGGLQIDIVDNGPGLAVEVRDNPFQAFVTTKPGGLGMGLAISRSLVEAHGGTITIVPNPTQGVTVQLVLPRMWQEDRA